MDLTPEAPTHPPSADASLAIRAEGLRKSFGHGEVLRAVDLAVEEGSVFALLGPNGAGKTTTLRILTTLLRPDSGSATVGGYDVERCARYVRRLIAVSGQRAAIDDDLTGRENLELVGALSGLRLAEARERTAALLTQFDLAGDADRLARGYSGGVRRRLDLAMSLVSRPRILFLDEPTVELDPRSRRELWSLIQRLAAEGTTVFLTTQYLEEADALAGKLAILDRGRKVAEGTPAQLKERCGGYSVVLRPAAGAHAEDVVRAVRGRMPHVEAEVHEGAPAPAVTVPLCGDRAALIGEVVQSVAGAGITLAGIDVHEPTLDDVFFAVTGRRVAAQDGSSSHDRLPTVLDA